MIDSGVFSRTQPYSRAVAHALGQAAQLAYSDSTKVRAALAPAGFTEVFQVFDVRDTQVFVAGSRDAMIVSFRGTEPAQLRDWMTDLDIDLVGTTGGRVHEGFNTALAYVWRDLWSFVHAQRGKRTLWITGHSLGGALATLCAARLRLDKDEPVNGVYTFGAPRAGDTAFAKAYDADAGALTFRYVNNNDIVTRVPFRSMKYSHVGELRYFDEHGRQKDDFNWWEKLLDRVDGRVQDLLRPGPDGLKDHAMTGYLANLERAARS